jgi:DNA-binding NtrC family response regulator
MTAPSPTRVAPTVLVVEDNDSQREYMRRVLEGAGYQVPAAGNVPEGRALIEGRVLEMAFLDLGLPPDDGRELVALLRQVAPEVPVVIVTSNDTATTAVELMRGGAFDYVVKPVDGEALLRRAAQGVELCRARRDLGNLRALRGREETAWYVGETPRMMAVEALVDKCAPTPTSVLIQGASGTGKEVVAQSLHRRSKRADGPFIAINCAALPEQLLESELFGHEKGAFTGAFLQRRGMLELANGGTLFLDELTSMSPEMQAKLLRALQEFTFRRVGGTKEIKVDVRVISASNRDVVDAIRAGQFREDLFYRLCVVTLELPSLRDRAVDIPHFVHEFIAEFRGEMGATVTGITDAAMWALCQYDWPGNIRELRNVIERSVIVANGADRIDGSDLAEFVRAFASPAKNGHAGQATGTDPADDGSPPSHLPADGLDLKAIGSAWEQAMIEQALARTDGNQSAAARLLNLSRDELRYRLEKYGRPA